MAPTQVEYSSHYRREAHKFNGSWRDHASAQALVLEAWSEGCMFGALMIMICVTIASMRRNVLLHKLILLELSLAILHGTFCFMSFPGYGWYLSSTAALLYCSWLVHNLVAWIKIRPFFNDPRSSLFSSDVGKWVGRVYLATLGLTIPPIVLQTVSNFLYFNNINDIYIKVRPTEAAFRDPWWVFTCLALLHVIRKCYGSSVFDMIVRSPRLGILLAAICLAMIFTLMDILAASIPRVGGSVEGINPYWKLSLIFKCLTDNIMLDDFSTELKKLGAGSNIALQEPQSYDLQHPTVSEKEQGTSEELQDVSGRGSRAESDAGQGLKHLA